MTHPTRRHFLGTAAAAGLAVPLALADDAKKVAANDKVTVALVGCGGMGRANLRDFIRTPEFEVVALCDPDSGHIKEAMADLQKGNRPTEKVQAEQDFRKVI